jgi:transcriptional regulator with XRE-family HTH domain
MPTMPTDLGTLVATERQRLNWSLRDVRAHGGPAHNTISLIERGEVTKPDAETLWKIAVAFADGGGSEVGEWFARLLRVAGYPLDAEADAVVAKLVSVLDSAQRQQILEMTPEQLDLLLSLWASMRGSSPPQ